MKKSRFNEEQIIRNLSAGFHMLTTLLQVLSIWLTVRVSRDEKYGW